MAHIDEPPGQHYHHEGAITTVDVADREDVHKLKGSAVGLVGVLFLCVTGSAPLAVVMFNMPYAIPLGSGYGGPAAFFFATIVLTIFSVAYVEMAKKVHAAGGMYTSSRSDSGASSASCPGSACSSPTCCSLAP